MKIKKTADELRLEVYSRFLFRFWGLMFIAAGLIFLLPIIVQYQIHCEEKGYNEANRCTLTTSVLKIYNKNNNLGKLLSATVSNIVEERTDSIRYSLVLNTSMGSIKIANINSKENGDIIEVANSVENYISKSLEKSTTIPKVRSWWSYFKVTLFFLLGFGSLLFRLITITINKKTNTLTIAAKNIINTQAKKIAIADIEKVIIEEHGKSHKEYSLAVLLKNGKSIHLPGVHDSSLQHINAIAQEMKPFLNLVEFTKSMVKS